MPPHLERIPKVLELYLQISQYPILGRRIRTRMRQELFARGIITPGQFEQEVKEKAVLSQQREGLADPFVQETAEVWQERLVQIRDHMTDFYFAYNFFRLAAILQGIAGRVRDGTAASAHAGQAERAVAPLAALGWQYATRA